MHPNAQTLTKFYTAFAALDPDTMATCYADEVAFDDEVFSLRGKAEVMGMWRMLCEAARTKGRDVWKLDFSAIDANAAQGQAHWDAHYRFSATGRMVLNRIDGVFSFNPQGLITRHRDSFSFWTWSRQALGAPGLLLGWTPFLRNKVRAQALANLRKFAAR
ncbi:MAG: nuclear transport factor 2 family protein [Rhodoferax sp.]|nr:nuclear transport factor 2 family protein [Rhodoferax sp.]